MYTYSCIFEIENFWLYGTLLIAVVDGIDHIHLTVVIGCSYVYILRISISTGQHFATCECTSEPAPKKQKSDQINVCRLKARYHRLFPPSKTDYPKHKVTQYIRLALIEKEDVTLRDDHLDELTKMTLQGDIDSILKKKEPLNDLRDIFHYQNEPCPQLILIMGGPGE